MHVIWGWWPYHRFLFYGMSKSVAQKQFASCAPKLPGIYLLGGDIFFVTKQSRNLVSKFAHFCAHSRSDISLFLFSFLLAIVFFVYKILFVLSNTVLVSSNF